MLAFVSDIAVFVLKRDVKLQLTNYASVVYATALPIHAFCHKQGSIKMALFIDIQQMLCDSLGTQVFWWKSNVTKCRRVGKIAFFSTGRTTAASNMLLLKNCVQPLTERYSHTTALSTEFDCWCLSPILVYYTSDTPDRSTVEPLIAICVQNFAGSQTKRGCWRKCCNS